MVEEKVAVAEPETNVSVVQAVPFKVSATVPVAPFGTETVHTEFAPP